MRQFDIVVYGSYGYTGKLIVDELLRSKENVLLAGRDQSKLAEQSAQTNYPFEAVDLNDETTMEKLLRKATLVIHCAGPFQSTASQMIAACLKTQTHYLDITGEYSVFELLAGFDDAAKKSGIMVMPGTGFDVVPSDCLAVHLKNRLPDATHLQLAFTMSGGGLSRGTGRTMVEGLGYGGMIRSNGKLKPITLGSKTLDVQFCEGTRKTMCIPWGDISTAWRSTQIPNIEVYTGLSASAIIGAKLSRPLNWLFRMQAVKTFLRNKVDARPSGPSEEKRQTGKSYLWGRAWNSSGKSVEARMKTLSGYALTGAASALIARKLIAAAPKSGYFTPAQYFGEGLIFEVAGTEWC
jgi:short subunit dehydrogenase-like uncharacterized protein